MAQPRVGTTSACGDVTLASTLVVAHSGWSHSSMLTV
jgi:hypothetical protein